MSKGKGQTKGRSHHPKGTNKICTTYICHTDQRWRFYAKLQPHVGSDRKEPMENTWQAQGPRSWRCVPGPCPYVHACQAGAHHRAVLSDSSSESLLSVTECRRVCSRGLRRSVDPSSMWMEGISKWTTSAIGREKGR